MKVCTSVTFTQMFVKCVCFYEHSCHLKEPMSAHERPMLDLIPLNKILVGDGV